MLNNTIGLDSDIIEEFDVTNCLSMTYTKDSVNFRCRLNKTGSDWDIYCGSIIGSDYVKYITTLTPKNISQSLKGVIFSQ